MTATFETYTPAAFDFPTLPATTPEAERPALLAAIGRLASTTTN